MEIVRVLRCPDGRLIVLAAGLGRIKVEGFLATQKITYHFMDVSVCSFSSPDSL